MVRKQKKVKGDKTGAQDPSDDYTMDKNFGDVFKKAIN